MKICPRCGYIDRTMWRQNRWRTNVEFLKLEYPEYIDPWILKKLKERRGIQLDENYAYRLTGRHKNIVERVLREQYEIDGPKAFHLPREHINHSRISISRKLTEILKGAS